MPSIEDYLEEEAAKRRAQAIADEQNPELQARLAAKRKDDHDRGVRLGWWDANGDPIPQDDEQQDGDDEEEA